MADISGSWDKLVPSGTSEIPDGDDLLREHWASIQSGFEEEHFYADSAASAGIHKKGSARAFVGVNSSDVSTSGADDEGRLVYVRDENNLHFLGQSGTSGIYGGYAGVFLEKSNDQSVVAGGSAVSWESGDVAADPLGFMAFSSGSTTHIEVPSGQGGFYRLDANIPLASTTNDSPFAIRLLDISSATIQHGYASASTVNGANQQDVPDVNLSAVMNLSAGNTLEVWTAHADTAVETDTLAGVDRRPWLNLQRIR